MRNHEKRQIVTWCVASHMMCRTPHLCVCVSSCTSSTRSSVIGKRDVLQCSTSHRRQLPPFSCLLLFCVEFGLAICQPSAVNMINVEATRADTRAFLALNILESAATMFMHSLLFLDSIRGVCMMIEPSPGSRALILRCVFVIQVGFEMTVICRASAAMPSIRWINYESLRRSYMWAGSTVGPDSNKYQRKKHTHCVELVFSHLMPFPTSELRGRRRERECGIDGASGC